MPWLDETKIGIGRFHPPVGVNLFVASRVPNVGLDKIVPETIPFLAASAIGLLLVFLFPGLSTWLPSKMH